MIINGSQLLDMAPIKDMETSKKTAYGTSYGLSEAGYDIRLKQDIRIWPNGGQLMISRLEPDQSRPELIHGNFVLASAIEEFHMPDNLVGYVKDKSTLARDGLSVFNTVIEPGWKGWLTLELVFHKHMDLHIPAGSGIAQVVFHEVAMPVSYDGKYQNQEDKPVGARKW